jgi:hypothetical protein
MEFSVPVGGDASAAGGSIRRSAGLTGLGLSPATLPPVLPGSANAATGSLKDPADQPKRVVAHVRPGVTAI